LAAWHEDKRIRQGWDPQSNHLVDNPVNGVPDAEADRQQGSWSAQGGFPDFPREDACRYDAEYAAYDFGE
jgi:hypothetical protein